MIDLHNHILPGVDDGAADMDESLDIARQFVTEGVQRVAATPHLDPENGRGIHAPEMRRRVRELQDAIDAADIPLRVEPGQEVYLTPDVPRLLGEDIASYLGNAKCVLVELSLTAGSRPLYLEDTLFRLQLEGVQPILAHPERYAFVQRDVTSLDALIDGGIAMQLTAPSLLGDYGAFIRRVAERLLQRGSYTLAASDRHHPGLARSLAALHRRICEMTDVETAELLLQSNPTLVLEGGELLRPAVRLSSDRSFFGRLFGRV